MRLQSGGTLHVVVFGAELCMGGGACVTRDAALIASSTPAISRDAGHMAAKLNYLAALAHDLHHPLYIDAIDSPIEDAAGCLLLPRHASVHGPRPRHWRRQPRATFFASTDAVLSGGGVERRRDSATSG